MLKKEIERLGRILDLPVKDVGVHLCDEGVHNKDVIDKLSEYFVASAVVRIENTLYRGSDECKQFVHDENAEMVRISFIFDPYRYEDISLLTKLSKMNPSRIVALLVDLAIRNVEVIEIMLHKYNDSNSLSPANRKEIKLLMAFVVTNNPYKKTAWSPMLLSTLARFEDKPKPKRSKLTREQFEKGLDRSDYKWDVSKLPPLRDKPKNKVK